MQYRSCRRCLKLKPQTDEFFSQYGAKRRWKPICNECLDEGALSRIRKLTKRSLEDSRDGRHPLEFVMLEWVRINGTEVMDDGYC
jgi:hypothetical protein